MPRSLVKVDGLLEGSLVNDITPVVGGETTLAVLFRKVAVVLPELLLDLLQGGAVGYGQVEALFLHSGPTSPLLN